MLYELPSFGYLDDKSTASSFYYTGIIIFICFFPLSDIYSVIYEP